THKLNNTGISLMLEKLGTTMKANTLLSKPISYSNFFVNICALLILVLASSQASAVGSAKRTYSGTDGVLNTFFSQCTGCHTGDAVSATANWDEYGDASSRYADIYNRAITVGDMPPPGPNSA